MDIESMREEYESALICREVASLLAKAPEMEEASAEIITRAICLERKGDGYAAVVPDYGWWAWQASRQSLVVNNFSTYKFEGCKYYDAESVDDALTDAGITRK